MSKDEENFLERWRTRRYFRKAHLALHPSFMGVEIYPETTGGSWRCQMWKPGWIMYRRTGFHKTKHRAIVTAKWDVWKNNWRS